MPWRSATFAIAPAAVNQTFNSPWNFACATFSSSARRRLIAMLTTLLAWQRQTQLGASALVTGFGAFLLVWRRHPRVLVRIPPSRLALWSFAIAMAHGAGLMLVPIYLGLCHAYDDQGHRAAQTLIEANLGMALLVAGVHAGAMMVVGGLLAWLVYRYLGLKFVSRSWFNLDAVWALSLVLVGALSLALNAAVVGEV